MYLDELRLALAHAVALNRHATGDVALLWRNSELICIQESGKVNPNDTGLGLPIVRLLRNRGERMGKGYVIATTAAPTEACLGMARMCGIASLFYLKGGNIVQVACKRTGTTSTSTAPASTASSPT
jgi:hypothetical protein